jgi:hypothetical protein
MECWTESINTHFPSTSPIQLLDVNGHEKKSHASHALRHAV